MVSKKDMAVAILATFCLTSTLFMAIPIKSQDGTISANDYDPWADTNDDGIIDIFDIAKLAGSFGAEGEPINKTALLLELQSKVAELEDRVAYLELIHPPQPPYPDWFNGLVGYWKFNEGEGTIAFDSSGYGNNGTLLDGPTWVDGKYGKALGFDGIDDYIYIENSSSIVIHECVSVECWIRISESTNDHQTILTQRTADKEHYVLEMQPNGRTVQFAVIPPGQIIYAVSQIPIDFGSWTHLVGTYNGTTVCIYVNGTCTGSAYCVGLEDIENTPVHIGAYTPDVPWDRNWFKGTIDEVRLYNRTLTTEEVFAHYIYPPP